MTDPQAVLEQLNLEIGIAETRGDKDFLRAVIAPQLAFLRADGKTVDDRNGFLEKVKPSDPRHTVVRSIDVFGRRALVRCTVAVGAPEAQRRYDNLRLFALMEGRWQLLGWANELE